MLHHRSCIGIILLCGLDAACLGPSDLESVSAGAGTGAGSSVAGEIVSLARSRPELDRVRPGDEGVVPDEVPDHVYDMTTTGAVRNIRLTVTDERGFVIDGTQWDTIGGDHVIPTSLSGGFRLGAETWVLGVEQDGALLNRTAPPYVGELAATIGPGSSRLRLYAAEPSYFPYLLQHYPLRTRADIELEGGGHATGTTSGLVVAIDRIDRVSPADGGVAPDGEVDLVLDLSITGRIADLRLAMTDSDGTVLDVNQWDTFVGSGAIPAGLGSGWTRGEQTWVLGVEEADALLNQTRGRRTGSLRGSLGPGAHYLRLYATVPHSDIDEFLEAKELFGQLFRVDAVLTDGTRIAVIEEPRCGGETDFLSDPLHCGFCGNACAAGDQCREGQCVTGACLDCGSGGWCQDGECECVVGPQVAMCDGECTSLQWNDNCGGCGNVCAEGTECFDGRCTTCEATGGVACDGLCRQLDWDPGHCGACGNACVGDTPTCLGGQCVSCESQGLASCGHSWCVDLRWDPYDCGGCGNVCPIDAPWCQEGACVTCDELGLANCFGRCADTSDDYFNCGACGNDCDAGQHCEGGRCVS